MLDHRFVVAVVAMIASALMSRTVNGNEPPSKENLSQFEEARTNSYAAQLEDHLRRWLVDDYAQRAEMAWSRDYSSPQAFLKSVEPNRGRWYDVLKPPALAKSGPLQRRPYPALAEYNAEWVTVPLGPLSAEGLLAIPSTATADNPVSLVIAQHGLGSFPEKAFGLLDPHEAYHGYAGELFKTGFAVLAPMNLRSNERCNRIERLCRLAGTSLPGVEFSRLGRLLDEVLLDERIDGNRVGMWGISRGGLETLFWVPLEPRIKVAIVCAFFNHRRNKMVVPDERYSCFLETTEDNVFYNGWLTEFTDSDLVSLICPRPLLVQTGKRDRIAHWPQVVEEFEVSKTHYEKLGVPERIKMQLHDGGHEIHLQSGIAFLNRWLREAP